jgi:hypothetical protein
VFTLTNLEYTQTTLEPRFTDAPGPVCSPAIHKPINKKGRKLTPAKPASKFSDTVDNKDLPGSWVSQLADANLNASHPKVDINHDNTDSTTLVSEQLAATPLNDPSPAEHWYDDPMDLDEPEVPATNTLDDDLMCSFGSLTLTTSNNAAADSPNVAPPTTSTMANPIADNSEPESSSSSLPSVKYLTPKKPFRGGDLQKNVRLRQFYRKNFDTTFHI